MEISIQLGKKILDFLAKKHNIDAIICDMPDQYAYARDNDGICHCIYYRISNEFLCFLPGSNAARLVRKMLQASAQGYDIKCAYRNGAITILPKYSTLEQLLVDIDLTNEIGC